MTGASTAGAGAGAGAGDGMITGEGEGIGDEDKESGLPELVIGTEFGVFIIGGLVNTLFEDVDEFVNPGIANAGAAVTISFIFSSL